MSKRGLVSQAEITEKTIDYRQRMLEFFKKEGGATFSEMHFYIEPDADRQKLHYHFYALKSRGYLCLVGELKTDGAVKGNKLWQARRDTYEHHVKLSANVIKATLAEFEDEPGAKKAAKEDQSESTVQVNGVAVRRVFERHPYREVKKSPKVYVSGATLGYAV